MQEHAEFDIEDLKEHEEATKVKNINKIELGKYVSRCRDVAAVVLSGVLRRRYEIDTWYYSPFPEEFRQCETLYFCEFCMKFMASRLTLKRHQVALQLSDNHYDLTLTSSLDHRKSVS